MEISKKIIFFSTLCIIIILLLLIQFILSIILIIKIKSDFKKRPEKDVDIIITGLKSFNFVEFSSRPRYFPSDTNLGLTGNLYLDCYTGTCYKVTKETKEVCDYDDDCETIEIFHNENDINKACSEQCFELKEKLCYEECSDYYDSKNGYCSRNTNDNYDNKKVCFGDNIIYFWKGKKYNIEAFQTKKATYINDAKLKDEPCPKNTKNCGILDDDENKLCLPLDSDCPINYISEIKLNEKYNYSSTLIDNKTFYYTYDNSSSNKKIIAGLYADSDIYLNSEEEEFITLDTYTISGFLKDNYILYRGLNLGYDPYNMSNIDKKGKSYLKIRYNAKNLDLAELRKNHQQYTINRVMNGEIIESVRKRFKTFYILGIIAYIFAILFTSFALYFICKGDKNVYACIIVILILLLIFSLFGSVKSCKNINKFNRAKEIDILKNYDTIRITNLLYVICGFMIFAFLITYLLVECIIRKCKGLSFNFNNTIPHEPTRNDLADISNQIPSTGNIFKSNSFQNK